MDSGYYAAFSGWLARSQALDLAAGNLANAGTAGYRAERDYFRSVILGPDALHSQLDSTVNAFGVLGGSRLDFGQGALTPTGNPLDLAIEGDGFFAIQTQQGVRYTRDGQFERSQDGTLTTQAGEPVLDARQQPIRVPAGEVAVGADGAVSVNGALPGKWPSSDSTPGRRSRPRAPIVMRRQTELSRQLRRARSIRARSSRRTRM
jgi:flagellar basal-body rod protein FlgF